MSRDNMYLVTEATNSEGNVLSVALNRNNGESKRWGLPAEQQNDTTPGFGQNVKRIFSGINLASVVADPITQTFYGVGYVELLETFTLTPSIYVLKLTSLASCFTVKA
jgi:hypothetical protein